MRPIDADALEKALEDWVRDHWTDAFTGDDAGSEFADMIDREETIDTDPAARVKHITEVETENPKIGDQISVDHYTATCQTVTPKGALFLLNQYLDKSFPMNV